MVHIGCAGWTIPKLYHDAFPEMGSHLQRYASRFNAVEINSSFHRPHRTTTYARWASAVPADFRFAVKLPRVITHERRLVDVTSELDTFLSQIGALGPKLGPILVQLPPSFVFAQDVVAGFFTALRRRFTGDIVCEPRHRTWFSDKADDVLIGHRIASVAADPAVTPRAATPGGWEGLAYIRLHGTPRMYYSSYPADTLNALGDRLTHLEEQRASCWCVFDNTAAGAATANALHLQERLTSRAARTSDARRTSHIDTPPPT